MAHLLFMWVIIMSRFKVFSSIRNTIESKRSYTSFRWIIYLNEIVCWIENLNLNSQMKSILQSECKDDESKYGLVNNYLFCPLGDKIVTNCHLITRFDASDWWTMQIKMVSKMINSNIINFSKNWVFSNSKENSNYDINKQ